jgi:hypothetical protein
MKWQEFYFKKSITLHEDNQGVENLAMQAHQIMSPHDKEKVNKVLASPTLGDSWWNMVQATIKEKSGRGQLTPQAVSAIMLDGIDQYLKTTVSNSKSNRVPQPAQRPVYTPPKPISRPSSPDLYANAHAAKGEVPQAEILGHRLSPFHQDVWQGSTADAPKVYKYVYNKLQKKYLYNPNFIER